MDKNYDYAVIGGGPGGTPAAMTLAQAGKKVLLVEKGEGLGGTCLFSGCIPSKVIRESARRLSELRNAAHFGLCLPTEDVRVDWYAVMERKRRILRQRTHGAAAAAGHFPTLDVVKGEARFVDSRRLRVVSESGEQVVRFSSAIISTGSVASRPPLPGADHHRVIDSEGLLSIDSIPENLTIIGGGPEGVELAQMFHTLGSRVALMEAKPRLLSMVDAELTSHLEARMQADGIEVMTSSSVARISHTGDGVYVEGQDGGGKGFHRFADKVLMVTGRRPRVEGLGLGDAGVEHDRGGLKINALGETSVPGIYAVGDVTGQPMFAHWASAQGMALARNLLGQSQPLPEVQNNSAVIFSSPELAMVGLTEERAADFVIDTDVARYDFSSDARNQIVSADPAAAEGLLKLVYEKASHRLVGVHALVEGADALVGEAALAVKAGMTLEMLATTIHPHPTLSESVGAAARMALAQMRPS